MQHILTVQGMHCDACKKLIQMELADAGLDSFVAEMQVDQEKQIGTIILIPDVQEAERDAIRQCIESMEGYSVTT